jgi:hypothetical protein
LALPITTERVYDQQLELTNSLNTKLGIASSRALSRRNDLSPYFTGTTSIAAHTFALPSQPGGNAEYSLQCTEWQMAYIAQVIARAFDWTAARS